MLLRHPRAFAEGEISMSYSMVTMRAALKDIGISKGVSAFVWEKPGQAINPHLAKQFKYGRGQNFLNDMLEYCWLAYSKALNASGPQLIGRTGDLWIAQHLQRAGIKLEDQQTLWDPHTKGSIQVLDKWAPVVNDCWVLGGIHRLADFELVSIRTLKNLWDFDKGFHVVTAREILGLLNFGYSLKQQPNVTKLICTHPAKAQAATIQAYDNFMKGKESTGADSIRSILVIDPALKNEIQGFDRSRLRHVVPPR
jgi:hypothetical protein